MVPPLFRRSLHAHDERRGAALLLSLLVLLVLVVIMSQLNIATVTDARVNRNELALKTMDLAIESTLLEISETLITDADSAGADEGAEGADPFGGGGGGGGFPGAGGEEEGGGSGSTDSRQDDWATPIRTEINGIRLRVLIQDEDSKVNVLTMLSEDEEEAEKAFDRVVRVLDWCRHGTDSDIDGGDAREMALAMREHLTDRTNSFLPRPDLVTDLEEKRDLGLPLSLREFVVLEPFSEDLFRDYLDEDGEVVHSIASFLTVWSAVTTRDQMEQTNAENAEDGGAGGDGGSGDEGDDPLTASGSGGDDESSPGGPLGGGASASAQGSSSMGTGAGGGGATGTPEKMGVAVNINTAPLAVLRSLMDDRDVSPRLWDAVLEYRNEEDEEALGEDEEPPLNEFGEEIIVPKIFEDLSALEEFDDYRDLDAEIKAELDNLLNVESHVFSIVVTARKPTGMGANLDFGGSREEIEEEERSGQALTRTVRCVVWRRQGGDGWEIVPLERWEVLDYMPYEVKDYADDDERSRR